MSNHKRLLRLYFLACCPLLGCSEQAPLFSLDFINEVSGDLFPLTPGSNTGYVMVLGINDSGFSIEYVVTAETEEIVVELSNDTVTNFASQLLEPQTTALFTDVRARSLGTVFNNTPVDWPVDAPPGSLTLADVQSAVDQLAAKSPSDVSGRSFLRMLRVVRIGLGPDLSVPSNADNGIIRRPPETNVTENAGTVLSSNVNNLLSFDNAGFPAAFGNGDLIIYLTIANSTGIGGVLTEAGRALAVDGDFRTNTFEILRQEMGPISPRAP